MKRYWIKLELKNLDDPIMGQMPNHLWRRTIELFMLAGENGDDGLLQPVQAMAWRLRIKESDLDNSLRSLAEIGVVTDTPQGWVVTNFKESQAAISSTQRVQEFRKRTRSGLKLKRKSNQVDSGNELEELEDEPEDELEDAIEDATGDATEDETGLETEDETDDETGNETEEERSPSSSTSGSNSLSDSFPGSQSLGDEVQEKGTNAFAVYEANIAAITPIVADALRADIEDYGEKWVCDAIREAVRSNARNLKYAEAILRRWQIEGRGSPKRKTRTQNRRHEREDRDTEAEDRQKYVSGKYKDWIKH